MPHDLDHAFRGMAPVLNASPVVVAVHGPAQSDLLFTQWPRTQPDWTPASQWLAREGALSALPVVPVYLDQIHGAGVRVGKAIPPESFATLPDVTQRMRYLRWRISLLATRPGTTEAPRHFEPVALPAPADNIEAELAVLGPDRRLASSGDFEVMLTTAQDSPHTLTEIGRLRENAFRAVGEGTGRDRDIDRFDESYLHLLVWNSAAREIAGAYRLRLTGDNPAELYTATLFQYGPEFLRRLGPAIELGRSFIRVEYQRSFAPLLLLWKGIGRIVARNPGYKTLFGPVSISNQYQSVSRELMIEFLEEREMSTDLAELVRPRNAPARRSGFTAEFCRSIEELSGLVADLEPEPRGVPVLLRHYLRLGGKLLGFNVDRDFADALDGLIVVDLTRTEPRLLERYLGKAESAAMLAHQR